MAILPRDSNEKVVALLRQLTNDYTTQIPESERGATNPRRRGQATPEE